MPTRPDPPQLPPTRLFQRLSAPATLRDLALPAQTTEHLLTIASRGARGLRALFAGPAGTGKTLAVQALANQLELELWRIDLSAIVSKHIGETGKHLDRLFAAAADSSAILLFDEADAIFGKRTEVKDARDRYANIEIDYLLQRIEQYPGLVILTSDRHHDLDVAILQCISDVIHCTTT